MQNLLPHPFICSGVNMAKRPHPRMIQRGARKLWYADCRVKGVRLRDCLGTTDFRLAEKCLKRLEIEIEEGRYKAWKYTFEECCTRYFDQDLIKKSKHSQDRYSSIVRIHLIPVFKGMLIKDIIFCDPLTGHSMLNKFFDERLYMPESSLKKIARVLKDVISKSSTDFTMPSLNHVNKGFYQTRFLSEEQALLIIEHLPSKYKTLAMLMAYTGLRLGDAKNLDFNKINLKERLIITDIGKTGSQVKIPIANKLFESLTSGNVVPLYGDGGLFPFTKRSFQKAWSKAAKKVGFSWARPHDLRHFFTSYLLNHGVDHMTVATLLGSQSVNLIKRRLWTLQCSIPQTDN